MRWCVYDPLLSEAQRFATQMSFGDNIRLIPQFEKADVILSLDSDFLELRRRRPRRRRAVSSSRRRVREAKDSMNRLYVVENRFTSDRRDGGSSAALPGQPDPGVHASRSRPELPPATKDAGLVVSLIDPQGSRRRPEKFDASWVDEVVAVI